MDKGFVERIQHLIETAGGQSALARQSGLSLGAIQRYMKGGEPARGALMKLAESCNVGMDWLIYGTDENENSPGLQKSLPANIPVYGFAECGLQGWYNESRLRISTSLDWHDPETFAVIASGHSMAPEGIHPGFICIASPKTRPQRGDAVLIRRKDGTSTIKLYQHEDGEWLHVTGWLDPDKPGKPQKEFSDSIKRSVIDSIATIIMVRRRA